MRLNPSVPRLRHLEEVGVALGGGVGQPLDLVGGEEGVAVDSEQCIGSGTSRILHTIIIIVIGWPRLQLSNLYGC